jgi:hypothetical protein
VVMACQQEVARSQEQRYESRLLLRSTRLIQEEPSLARRRANIPYSSFHFPSKDEPFSVCKSILRKSWIPHGETTSPPDPKNRGDFIASRLTLPGKRFGSSLVLSKKHIRQYFHSIYCSCRQHKILKKTKQLNSLPYDKVHTVHKRLQLTVQNIQLGRSLAGPGPGPSLPPSGNC